MGFRVVGTSWANGLSSRPPSRSLHVHGSELGDVSRDLMVSGHVTQLFIGHENLFAVMVCRAVSAESLRGKRLQFVGEAITVYDGVVTIWWLICEQVVVEVGPLQPQPVTSPTFRA